MPTQEQIEAKREYNRKRYHRLKKDSVKSLKLKEQSKKGSKKYHSSEKGKIAKKKASKKYYLKNKSKIIDNVLLYATTEKGKEVRRNTKRKMRLTPEFKVMENLRNRIGAFLKFNRIGKDNKTAQILGCTPEQLRKHIENQFKPGMTWKNYNAKTWHIDHIIPLANAKNTTEVEKLCHYTNLQPLWAKENLRKGKKSSN